MLALGSVAAFVALVTSLYASKKAANKGAPVKHVAVPKAGTNPLLAISGDQTTIIFPYPDDAGLSALVICNHAGLDYWFDGANGAKGVHVPPVMMGEKCTTVPLSEACKDATCFHRGTLKPCSESQTCTTRQVTAGVNVIAGGSGSATCVVKCPHSNLMCQASTVVFISPAECQDVQVCVYVCVFISPATCQSAGVKALRNKIGSKPLFLLHLLPVACDFSKTSRFSP